MFENQFTIVSVKSQNSSCLSLFKFRACFVTRLTVSLEVVTYPSIENRINSNKYIRKNIPKVLFSIFYKPVNFSVRTCYISI